MRVCSPSTWDGSWVWRKERARRPTRITGRRPEKSRDAGDAAVAGGEESGADLLRDVVPGGLVAAGALDDALLFQFADPREHLTLRELSGAHDVVRRLPLVGGRAVEPLHHFVDL